MHHDRIRQPPKLLKVCAQFSFVGLVRQTADKYLFPMLDMGIAAFAIGLPGALCIARVRTACGPGKLWTGDSLPIDDVLRAHDLRRGCGAQLCNLFRSSSITQDKSTHPCYL